MTAESEVCLEFSQVSKAEIEDKCGLEMNSCQDLPKIGADCNGINLVDDDEHEVGANAGVDRENTYVIVSGNDGGSPRGAVTLERHLRPQDSECVEESKDVEVQFGQLNFTKGKHVQSFVAERDNCFVEGSGVEPSNNQVSPQDSIGEANGDAVEVTRSNSADEQNGTANGELEKQLDDGEVKPVDQVESDSVLNSMEEQNGTANGEFEKQLVDGEAKPVDQIELDSASYPEQNPEFPITSEPTAVLGENQELMTGSRDPHGPRDTKLTSEDSDTLDSTAEVGKSHQFQNVVLEAPAIQVGGVKSEDQTELDSAREEPESVESQIPVTTSAESTSCQLVNGKVKLNVEEKKDLDVDNLENQNSQIVETHNIWSDLDQQHQSIDLDADNLEDLNSQIAEINNIQSGSDQEHQSTELTNGSDAPPATETASDPVSHENTVSEIEELNKCISDGQNPPEVNESPTKAKSLPSTNCMSLENGNGHVLAETGENFPDDDEGETPDVKHQGSDISPVDGAAYEIGPQSGHVGGDGTPLCPANDLSYETESDLGPVEPKEKVPTFPCDDAHSELEIPSGQAEQSILVQDFVQEHLQNGSVSCLKSESDIEGSCAISSGDMPGNDMVIMGSEVLDSSVVHCGRAMCSLPEIVDAESAEYRKAEGRASYEKVINALKTETDSDPVSDANTVSQNEELNKCISNSKKYPELNESSAKAKSLPSTNYTSLENKNGHAPAEIGETFPDDNEGETSDVKNRESYICFPVDGAAYEIGAQNGPVGGGGMPICAANVQSSETESGLGSVEPKEKVTSPCEDVHTQMEVSNGHVKCSNDQSILAQDLDQEHLQNGNVSGLKSESDIKGSCAISRRDMPSNDVAITGSEVLDSSVVDCGRVAVSVPELMDAESTEHQKAEGGASDEKLICQENENCETIHQEGVSTSLPEASSADAPQHATESVTDSGLGLVEPKEKVTFPCEDVHTQVEVSNGHVKCANDQSILAQELDQEHLQNGNISGLKSESDIKGSRAISSRDMPRYDVAITGSEVLDSSVVDCGRVAVSVPELMDAESTEHQKSEGGASDEKLICQENENCETIHQEGISTSLSEGSSVDAQQTATEFVTHPFRFLIRIPRFDDEKLRDQIKLAQLQVEEKTKFRDDFRNEIHIRRANCQSHGVDYEAAKSEERAARKLVKSKRKEIDSVQSVINRVKNAISVEEIDGRIYNMEHMIEHETLPLKEEKQFIREIKQLKHLREQLSSYMGSQDEVQQALDQREQTEDRLKTLKKELDDLKSRVSRAETAAAMAGKQYEEENKRLKELQARFRAADDVRQEAYSRLLNLRRELFEKNKHFRAYKEDAKAASEYALSGERGAIHCLCVNQVEAIMELWSKNDEFRKEYVRCNMRSTLKKLGTLDGRSLGPDEEPPVLPSYVDEKVDRLIPAPGKTNSVPQVEEQEKQLSSAANGAVDGKSMQKLAEQKIPVAKSKMAPKSTSDSLATASERVDTEQTKEEDHKQRKEEQELARKAEELRKEEAAAQLKEQRRIEEKAKAMEALERKKRNAEKAQIRAELRARKEAEQKEKEREKRLRKKEKKNATAVEANDGEETAQSSEKAVETVKEPEIRESATMVTKKSQKPSQFTKHSKTKSIPPPLRNRGKRRMQQWMWVIFTALFIVALFLLGNIGFFSSLGRQRINF